MWDRETVLPSFGIPAIKPAKTGRKRTFPKMKKPVSTQLTGFPGKV